MLEEFPDKPKGMHWRTYDRIHGAYETAQARSMLGMAGYISRLKGQLTVRARR